MACFKHGTIIDLAARESVSLPDMRGTTLRVTRGTVWITQENDTQDIVLRAGDNWVVERTAHAPRGAGRRDVLRAGPRVSTRDSAARGSRAVGVRRTCARRNRALSCRHRRVASYPTSDTEIRRHASRHADASPPKSAAFKHAVLDGVHRALVASGVPEADRFQRVLELAADDFRFDPRYPDLARDRGRMTSR